MSRRILTVFGTRPEAIKLFPLVHAIEADRRLEGRVCVSAQHRGMLDQVLEIAGVEPDHDLDLMRPDQSLDALTAALLTGLGGVMDDERPDWVVVQGDTATAMAGALAAYYRPRRSIARSSAPSPRSIARRPRRPPKPCDARTSIPGQST